MIRSLLFLFFLYPLISAAHIVDNPEIPTPTIITDLSLVSPDSNGILYVAQANTGGDMSGDSWENALPELADALQAARELNQVTPGTVLQIWVAHGTYLPRYRLVTFSDSNPTDRDNTFHLVKDVSLYGGFAGDESLIDQRDLSNTGNLTILSGDFNGDDGPGLLNNGENAHHVLFSYGDLSTAVLDGFTVSGGNANGGGSISVNGEVVNRSVGGGMVNILSEYDFRNIIFTSNWANSSGGAIYSSDDLYITAPPKSSIHNCQFTDNRAGTEGGAIYSARNAMEITNSSFKNNYAGFGGAIKLRYLTMVNIECTVTNCLFDSNTAGTGGVLDLDVPWTTKITFTNCTAYNNDASGSGDFLYFSNVTTPDKRPEFKNCIIITPSVSNFNAGTGEVFSNYIFKNTLTNLTDATISTHPDNQNNILNAVSPFTDPDNGDFSVMAGSPVIDGGENSYFDGGSSPDISWVTTDLAGNPRFYMGGTVDLGAYEYPPLNPLTALVTQTDVQCAGTATGSAQLTVSGGVAPYTYLWNNGQTTASLSELPAGSYSCSVTDANNATIIRYIVIGDTTTALTSASAKTDVLCHGTATGEATVTVTGGVAPYSYLWSDGQITATATGLVAGDYSVVVTDDNGCTYNEDFTIDEPDAITATPNTNQVDVLCNGDATGEATIVVTGGMAPYSYLWDDGQTTATITGLTAGLYSVEVTDDNGCVFNYDFTINEPTALAIAASQTDVLCYGASTGAASVVVSGGVGPYTYEWGNGETTAAISDIPSGDYFVTVTDDNGCTLVQNFTINEPTEMNVSSTQVNIVCNGASTGEASVTVIGGLAPYTYLWTDGQITATATGLVAGDYSVVVTDDNGCTYNEDFTIDEPDAITATPNTNQVDVLCNGDATGEATIVVTGGMAPYSYLWNDGQTTATATGLTAGLYSVEVTDDNGCVFNYDFTINEPTALAIAASQTDVLCYGAATGAASVVVSGGVGPYTYEWGNGETTAAISDIPSGDYYVTVTDDNGCTLVQNFTINEPTELNVLVDQVDIVCNGAATGEASVTVSGGVGPYTYLWSTGATTSGISGLISGDYSITVTDDNGCVKSLSLTITEPDEIAMNLTQSDIICNGSDTGMAALEVYGGVAPYTYLWSNGETSAVVTGLGAGDYSVTVTDINGCSLSQDFSIGESTALTGESLQTDILCSGSANGTASIVVSGGLPPYSYLWNNGAVTDTINGLAAGDYSVVVTDANGCTITQDYTITEPTLLTTTSGGVNITCFNAANGSATVVAAGGVTPYTYLWSNGETTATIANLTPGAYTATVTDAHGCTSASTVVITQPQVLTGYIAQTNVACNGGGNGAATINVNGGTAPYTYVWNTGSTAQTIAGLSAGSYSVTITDANGCQLVRNATISQPSPLFIAAGQVNPTCVSSNNGTASVTAYGGTAPYTYLWSTGATTTTISNLAAGSYTVFVTDAHGCTENSVVNIQALPAASITAQPADELAVNDGNAHFVATVANAVTYQWQESVDGGVTWNNVVNGGVNPTYMGAQTNTLVLVHIPLSHNGRRYRVIINGVIGCTQTTQPALLTVTNTIWATDDDFTNNPVYTGNGGTAGNIFDNDTFNGSTVNGADVTVSIVNDGGLTGVSIDADGNLIVPVGATPGTYVVVYEICNTDVTTSCDTAEVTVVVSSVLGIDDFTVVKPEVYPNPASTEVFIKLPENTYTEGMHLAIYDLNGRLVKEQAITSELTRVDIEALEAAEYILTIATEQGTVSKRIVKRR